MVVVLSSVNWWCLKELECIRGWLRVGKDYWKEVRVVILASAESQTKKYQPKETRTRLVDQVFLRLLRRGVIIETTNCKFFVRSHITIMISAKILLYNMVTSNDLPKCKRPNKISIIEITKRRRSGRTALKWQTYIK